MGFLGGGTGGVLLEDVAAQHSQGKIPLEANFALIATTHQSVARLQRANRRLDARVTLLRLMKHNGRGFGLFDGLLFARFRKTDMGHEFGELPLVFGRMKTAIERDFFDTILKIVDVGFHHKRIGALFLYGVGLESIEPSLSRERFSHPFAP